MGIIILGLGPGDPRLLTVEALEVLKGCKEIYLRTRFHPTVAALPPELSVHSFDHLYEEKATFQEVYEAIAQKVVELGKRPQGVVYAVPGHPMVGETSVKRILALAKEQGLPVRIVEGVSFLAPLFSLLELDPLEGLQLLDATDLARRPHPPLNPDLPVLIGQLYDRALASEVKLTLMNLYPDEHPVTLVRGAGAGKPTLWTGPLYELDRRDDIDHLTSLYIPPLPRPGSMEALQELVARLRAPDGCPWDRQQTHRSLRPFLLEEAYEVLEALDAEDVAELRDELGDLLLQIALHVQIATEEGEFKFHQVIERLLEKLVRRHPHVFGDVVVSGAEEVLHNWEEIKKGERAEQVSILSGVPKTLPALAQAQAYQRRAARVGFDWPGIEGVWDKVREELEELKRAAEDERERELGDLLFSVVNLARWLGLDAESALREANARFVRRFSRMERLARNQGRSLSEMPLAEQDELWEQTKKEEPGCPDSSSSSRGERT